MGTYRKQSLQTRMKNTMHVLTPAYGRDYTSKAQVLSDWNDGKDFLTNPFNGPSQYINSEQVKEGEQIQFRFKKLQNVFIHKQKKQPVKI